MNEIIAYKGFDSKLQCRDFQYEIGKTYEHDDKVVPCRSGFHACEHPLHVFDYYDPTSSRFCKVLMSGEIIRHNDKIVASKIEILEEISVLQLTAEAEKMSDNVKYSEENYSVASNSGEKSVASNTGICSVVANTGICSVAANSGGRSVASNTGHFSVAANSGIYSVASNSGSDSVAIASGRDSKAKASLGSVIFLVYRDDYYKIIHHRSAMAGKDVKPDVFYKLDENGEFVECE